MFHDRAAATGNARSPRLDRLVAGRNRVDAEPDRRRRHALVSDVRLLPSNPSEKLVVIERQSGGIHSPLC